MSEETYEYELVTDIQNSVLLDYSYGYNIHIKLKRRDIVSLLNGEKLVIFDGYEYCTILEVK